MVGYEYVEYIKRNVHAKNVDGKTIGNINYRGIFLHIFWCYRVLAIFRCSIFYLGVFGLTTFWLTAPPNRPPNFPASSFLDKLRAFAPVRFNIP